MKVGYIGYGSSVRVFHLPYLPWKPYAFLQRSEPVEGKPHCTIDYPDVKRYTELGAFLADEDINVVVVCTGPESHADLAIQCIQAGKDVVVEKPFTVTTEEADRLISAAKGKVLLSVYQSESLKIKLTDRRYDSDFLTLKRLIEEKALGEVLEAEFHHDLVNPPMLARMAKERMPGRGMAYTAGSHVVDQALSLFGLPKTITGFFHSFRGVQSDNEDSYTITMEYETLVIHVKTNSRSVMLHPLTYFIRGTEGSFLKFGKDPQLEHTKTMSSADPRFGMEDEETWGVLTTLKQVRPEQKHQGMWVGKIPSERGSWSSFYRDLEGAINGEPLRIDPELSRAGIRVLELAWESVESGRKMPYA